MTVLRTVLHCSRSALSRFCLTAGFIVRIGRCRFTAAYMIPSRFRVHRTASRSSTVVFLFVNPPEYRNTDNPLAYYFLDMRAKGIAQVPIYICMHRFLSLSLRVPPQRLSNLYICYLKG